MEEMENYINEKLGKLPIHQILKQICLNGLFWDFDAVSLYPSAMLDEKSIYPRIKTDYAFTAIIMRNLLTNLVIKRLHKEVLF